MEDVDCGEVGRDELVDYLEDVAFDDVGVGWVGGTFWDGTVDYVCEDDFVGGVGEESAGEELA